jgi:tetratricopeptide (TPR) repeat protein
MYTLGQRIRQLRLKHGLTQIDLSKGICTPSMISQIESDRARPSYKILFSIAERLDTALEALLADVDMNLEYLSTYKMARSMVAGKEYASAIPLLKELVELPRPQLSTLDMLFDLGVCYLQTGQLDEADKLFAQVQDLALVRQDRQLQGQALLNIGLVEFKRKHYQLAAYQWQKALEEVERLEEPDLFLTGSLLYQLGCVHVKLGQIQEALTYYLQAAQMYEQSGNQHEIGQTYMGLGTSYERLGDLEQAAHYSERAFAIFEGLNNKVMAIKLNVICAIVYGRMGRTVEALQMLEDAIQSLQEMNLREEEGMAQVELAKLTLEMGEVQQAEEACRQARSLLPELHLYHAWINRILGKIALQRNQRDEAIRRYKAAADCFKRMEEVHDWDDTMYELVALYDESGDKERAYDTLTEIRRFSRLVLEERGIVL